MNVDIKSVYVTWKELESSGQEHPVAREMHSTCSYRDRMIISGGRSCEGDILSDVWELSPSDSLPDAHVDGNENMQVEKQELVEVKEQSQDLNVKEGTPVGPTFSSDALIFTVTSPTPDVDSIQVNAVSGGYAPSVATVLEMGVEKVASPTAVATTVSYPLAWKRKREMELRSPRCAHGSAIICRGKISSSTEATASLPTAADVDDLYLVLFGGFTGAGVAGDIALCPLAQVSQVTVSTQPIVSSPWQSPHINSGELQPRFGHSMTSISCNTIRNLLTNRRYAPIFSSATKAAADAWLKGGDEKDYTATPAAALIFGGVSELTDFGDIWLLLLT